MKKLLTEDNAQDFAWGDLAGYELVWDCIDKEAAYKDLAPAYTVCKDVDGLYWRLDWGRYVSHYGQGDHMYDDCTITQVERNDEEVKIIKTTWDPVEAP